MQYNSYRYLFPPRPELKIKPSNLPLFDNRGYMYQPKLNGSCFLLFTNGKELHVMNRHEEEFTNQLKIPKIELMSLHSGTGWMVLVGEYLNKSCRDENGQFYNLKLNVFDVLVLGGEYLLNDTFLDRYNKLHELYNTQPFHKPYLSPITENINLVHAKFNTGSFDMYNELTKWDLYEGIVAKKMNAPLENGFRKANNVKSQFKSRRETKNYTH